MTKYSLDQFLQACRAAGPLQLSVTRGGEEERHAFQQPFAVVGRDARADLRLGDARAGRRHAYIQVLGGRVLCLDLASTAAISRDSFPPHGWLNPGRSLHCPGATIRLTAPDPGALGWGPADGPPDSPPGVALEIVGAADGRADYRVTFPLVLVGSAGGCQVQLRDPSVSRFHCALVSTPAGLWAVDLFGRGGIAVNGVMARAVRLDDGDELRVGTFQVRPRIDPALATALPDLDLPLDLPVPELPRPDALPAEWPAPVAVVPPPDASLAVPPTTPPDAPLAMPPPTTPDAALAPLLPQIMRQMGEQFRLTMTGVVEAFREMHRDQTQLLWRELVRVQQLSEELASLKAELARAATAPAAGPREADRPAAALGRAGPVEDTGERVTLGSAPRLAPVPRRDADLPLPEPASPTPGPVGDDLHAWLSRRVADVQREREGRWQKILGFLTGAAPTR